MLKRTLNKSGISPVIATLLLLSFAIGLGVVFMTLGRAQVELEAACPLRVGLHQAPDSKICHNDGSDQFLFSVENGVNVEVEGLIINLVGSSRADTFTLKTHLARAGTYTGSIPYDLSLSGAIRQAKVTPQIVLKDRIQICPEEAVVFENVGPC